MAIISNEIRLKITSRIQNNRFFSIILDGTTDITRKEQISFCFRTVSKNLEIEEHFHYFVEDTEGETLFNLVKTALSDFSLLITIVTGQCYDRASNMSSVYNFIAARIK
ncbi:unnamed protein product [Brachionus calyciflorus]|uniref:DUF4371 domain-containing protein n=1 Tax=Brachionus calyciflorus TaxID=104777 RepID=A0A814G6S6_9BILA|nr:unnamed protein product [Brachionus calyciflorus]